MKIIYITAECYAGCEDEDCPYIHSGKWQYVKTDGTLSDGFNSEDEAISAALECCE